MMMSSDSTPLMQGTSSGIPKRRLLKTALGFNIIYFLIVLWNCACDIAGSQQISTEDGSTSTLFTLEMIWIAFDMLLMCLSVLMIGFYIYEYVKQYEDNLKNSGVFVLLQLISCAAATAAFVTDFLRFLNYAQGGNSVALVFRIQVAELGTDIILTLINLFNIMYLLFVVGIRAHLKDYAVQRLYSNPM